MAFLRRIAISATLLFTVFANAQGTSFTGTLANLRNGWGGEGFYFDLSGAASNGCTFPASYKIDATRSDLTQIVALVLLAYSNGKTVVVQTDGTCNNGAGNVIGVVVK